MGGAMVGAGHLQLDALLTTRRGHGAPPLPLSLPPHHAPYRLVFLAGIGVGMLWMRFIGVATSVTLFVLFNILYLWGVYVFVI